MGSDYYRAHALRLALDMKPGRHTMNMDDTQRSRQWSKYSHQIFKDELIPLLLFVLLVCVFTYLGWWRAIVIDVESWIGEYWQYSPNAYRLWQQLILFISSFSIPITTLNVISWAICLILVYPILRPGLREVLILLAWHALVCAWCTFYNAPALILIALAARYPNHRLAPALILPLTLIKEFLGPTLLVFFLLFCENRVRWRAIFWSFIAGITYLVLRIMIIGERPNAPPPFAPAITPLYVIEVMNWVLFIIGVVPTIGLILLTMLYYRRVHPQYLKRALSLVLITALPIALFALFWEPQLWLPQVLILLAHKFSNPSPVAGLPHSVS